ncbi:hypothetical protein [Buttiauxella gaviniae]|uniref:hypothetical protein n=1 Tax=Buttiauxella gaviniae TaxID=82990 RepID=UPI003974F19C
MFCRSNGKSGRPTISAPKSNPLQLPPELQAWENLPCNLSLVHTIWDRPAALLKFLQQPAAMIFRQWDIISTSLVKLDQFAAVRRQCNAQLKPPLRHHRITGTYHKWGLVLDVPPQNIVGAFHADVAFRNHYGVPNGSDRISMLPAIERNGLLSQQILGTLPTQHQHINRVTKAPGFNQISTPQQILDAQTNGRQNEILVMGRPGVQYHNKASKEIKITGIVLFRPSNLSDVDVSIVSRLARINNIRDKFVGSIY